MTPREIAHAHGDPFFCLNRRRTAYCFGIKYVAFARVYLTKWRSLQGQEITPMQATGIEHPLAEDGCFDAT